MIIDARDTFKTKEITFGDILITIPRGWSGTNPFRKGDTTITVGESFDDEQMAVDFARRMQYQNVGYVDGQFCTVNGMKCYYAAYDTDEGYKGIVLILTGKIYDIIIKGTYTDEIEDIVNSIRPNTMEHNFFGVSFETPAGFDEFCEKPLKDGVEFFYVREKEPIEDPVEEFRHMLEVNGDMPDILQITRYIDAVVCFWQDGTESHADISYKNIDIRYRAASSDIKANIDAAHIFSETVWNTIRTIV